VFGPPAAQDTIQHTGAAIGLSARLFSCSAEGSSGLVAAGEPLAWGQIGEKIQGAYQNQTTGTVYYAHYSSLLLHT
jgi:hypothetical protein